MRKLTIFLSAALLAAMPLAVFAQQQEGQGGIPGLIEVLIEKVRQGDPDGLGRTPLGEAAEANCSVNHILRSIATGDQAGITLALQDAARRYQAVADQLDKNADQDIFIKPIDVSRWSVATDIDLSGVTTQADLLRKIAVAARASAEAATRISSGKGKESDLTLIVRNSADISRLIAVFFDLATV